MINSVRNTVLSVLNKNNYGYVSPQDFNLYAKQAQVERFEEYFSEYNKVINAENARLSGIDYADIRKDISEKLESFIKKTNLLNGAPGTLGVYKNNFFIPSLSTTGDTPYMINTIIAYPIIRAEGVTTGAGGGSTLVDLSANFIQAGVKEGDIVVNLTFSNLPNNSTYYASQVTVLSVASANILVVSDSLYGVAGQDYVVISAESGVEAEKVLESKIFMLNKSNLTMPSNVFPCYTLSNTLPIGGTAIDAIAMYPKNINKFGQVVCTYFRYPKDPKWTYITLFNGEPAFDQSQPDYQDFELPLEDEPKMVMKILQYCGVSIREIEIAQFGLSQEQQSAQTFNNQ